MVLLVVVGVSAQDTAIVRHTRLDSMQYIKDVVVYGTKPYKEVIPAQILSGKQLEGLNSHSVADAIRYFAGVQLKDYGGVGGIKTVDMRSMGTNHMGVFYDGIQLGNAQNGQIDLGRYSLDNIEEISLYNGQKSDIFQSARDYGSAGTVYIRTRQPKFKANKRDNLNVTMRTGSFGLANPSFRWEHKFNSHVSMALNTEYTYATGQYHFRYRKMFSDGVVAWDTTAVRKNGDIGALRVEGALFGVMTDGRWHA
ncbi:MAG: TonB-dependent receptor plug domain-containing protein, partial [Muribaculaceae bacterium]|nr:TonB-dependent receptor plug domain-containing protein [Muribaculaceae bacterium]